MAHKQIGQYIVAQGMDLGVRKEHMAYYQWIVTDMYGVVLGHYDDENMALILAKGLEKGDLKQLDTEIEKILLSNR